MTTRQTRFSATPILATLALLLPTTAAAQTLASEYGTSAKIACAPRMVTTEPDRTLAVTGSQEGDAKYQYGPADTLVISGGLAEGVQVGQEYFARRLTQRGVGDRGEPVILKTVGWVRIIATEEHLSITTVVRPCDAFQQGDFLELAEWPTFPAPAQTGQPDYDGAGNILFGLDGRTLLGTGQYVVINLGRDDQLTPGQRLTVFRMALGQDGPITELGEAIAVTVDADVATVRLTRTRDAIETGDLIAPHR